MDVEQTDVVVRCKNVLDQKELDVIEVMDILALLEVVGRCHEGIEDVLANPNDVVHDDVVCDVLLDVFEDAPLVEDPDVDALDVHLADVHSIPAVDLLVGVLLALDVELFVEYALLDDLLVLDAADVVYDLVLYAMILFMMMFLNVLFSLMLHFLSLMLISLMPMCILWILFSFWLLMAIILMLSLGDPDIALVDLDVIDPDEEAVVNLIVDVFLDVLSLDVLCRWQLACCRCSCSLYDGLLDVDANVESIILHKLFFS